MKAMYRLFVIDYVTPLWWLMDRPEGGGGGVETWLWECVAAVERADTYAILRTFSELICDDINLLDRIIRRDIVQYSAFLEKYVQQGLEQGIERGREQEIIEAILICLGTRFRSKAVSA